MTIVPRHVPSGTIPWNRPVPADRAAHSEAIERRIDAAAAKIADPDLQRLFVNCVTPTRSTPRSSPAAPMSAPDTFVLTGDIHAMWLRDSTRAGPGPICRRSMTIRPLDRLIRGVIHRQGRARCSSPPTPMPSSSTTIRKPNGSATKPRCGRACTSANGNRTR